MMNILAVCFKNKKLIKRVETKNELNKYYKGKEKRLLSFLNDSKDGLSTKQYTLMLEGIVCHSFYNKIKNPSLIEIIEEYYSLI